MKREGLDRRLKICGGLSLGFHPARYEYLMEETKLDTEAQVIDGAAPVVTEGEWRQGRLRATWKLGTR